MKTLRVLLKSHPDPKGVEILEVSNDDLRQSGRLFARSL